jgi:hypothetical protein
VIPAGGEQQRYEKFRRQRLDADQFGAGAVITSPELALFGGLVRRKTCSA